MKLSSIFGMGKKKEPEKVEEVKTVQEILRTLANKFISPEHANHLEIKIINDDNKQPVSLKLSEDNDGNVKGVIEVNLTNEGINITDFNKLHTDRKRFSSSYEKLLCIYAYYVDYFKEARISNDLEVPQDIDLRKIYHDWPRVYGFSIDYKFTDGEIATMSKQAPNYTQITKR